MDGATRGPLAPRRLGGLAFAAVLGCAVAVPSARDDAAAGAARRDGAGYAGEATVSAASDAETETTGPVPTTACGPGDWCWRHPLPQGNSVVDVFAVSAREAWAVGDLGTILHFADGAWAAVPSPTMMNFEHVWGTGPRDVWMWGRRLYGDGWSPANVLFRWDGAAFSQVPLGAQPVIKVLDGTAAAGVWLLAGSAVSSERPTLRRWNGRSFEQVPLPPEVFPRSLCVRSSADAWLLTARDSREIVDRLFRWDGARWIEVVASSVRERYDDRMACPADRVATLLVDPPDRRPQTRTVRGDVASDREEPPMRSALGHIVQTHHHEAYYRDGDDVLRWNEGGWAPGFSLADVARLRTPIFDFAEDGRAGWLATGAPLPLAWGDGRWAQLSFDPTRGVTCFFAEGGDEDPTVAFGFGVLGRRRGERWSFRALPRVDGGKAMLVWDAWGADGFGAWLVGAGGMIARWSAHDDSMTIARSAQDRRGSTLRDIDGVTASTAWAVGDEVVRLEGDHWVWVLDWCPADARIECARVRFEAVDVAGAADVLALGVADYAVTERPGYSVLAHFDGAGWRVEQIAEVFYRMIRTRDGTVYIANGQAVRARGPGQARWRERAFDGSVEALYEAPDNAVEVAVAYRGRTTLYALDGGELLPRAVTTGVSCPPVSAARAGTGGRRWLAGANMSVLSFEPPR